MDYMTLKEACEKWGATLEGSIIIVPNSVFPAQ